MPGAPTRRALVRGAFAWAAVHALPRTARAEPPPSRGVEVADGYRWDTIVAFGDPLDAAGARFGSDADFLAPFPITEGGRIVPDRMLLWVNHEFPPVYRRVIDRWTGGGELLPGDVAMMMGGSVVELAWTGERWELLVGSPRNFRIHGNTPGFKVTGPGRARLGDVTVGTISNCGGGVTPWGTVLSCEENFRYHVPDVRGVHNGRVPAGPGISFALDGLAKRPWFDLGRPGERYGWVVEVDPADRTFLRRHTALGRFRHESAAVRARPGRPLQVYLAEDRDRGCLWRYTSRQVWKPTMRRDEGSALLAEGVLEVAQLSVDGTGLWLPLDRAMPLGAGQVTSALGPLVTGGERIDAGFLGAAGSARTLGEIYAEDADLLVDASLAGLMVGGTGLGRPEGCIVSADGRVLLAVTNAIAAKVAAPVPAPWDDAAGLVLALDDKGSSFLWTVVARGGIEGDAPFARPDNLGEDADGALLVATDIDNEGPDIELARAIDNNGIFRVDREGRHERLLRAPDGAEVCSPVLAPDQGSILCTIQHPEPGWLDGRSAVGTIRRR